MFLLLAAALSVVGLLERPGWRRPAGAVLLAALLGAGLYRHQTLYLPLQQRADRWPVLLGEAIRRHTNPDDVVVVYGGDWSSEIPYYAGARLDGARLCRWKIGPEGL